jgi:hypothetical protein
MIDLIETCSVWDNNNKNNIQEVCEVEYVVLFMQFSIHNCMESVN